MTDTITDSDLATAVENYYARHASALAPEHRATLANAVKLIRSTTVCDIGSDDCVYCASALLDAESMARCTGSVSATVEIDNRKIGGALHVATYIREDI
jgi:hypothetical protein